MSATDIAIGAALVCAVIVAGIWRHLAGSS
jgi:hypothetical protein